VSSRNEEIQDPNLADLPPEAFEEIEGQPTLDQLETRIRAKREQAEQDAGIMQSPHHADDIEPIEPPAAKEPTEEPVEEEVTDDQADEVEEPEEPTRRSRIPEDDPTSKRTTARSSSSAATAPRRTSRRGSARRTRRSPGSSGSGSIASRGRVSSRSSPIRAGRCSTRPPGASGRRPRSRRGRASRARWPRSNRVGRRATTSTSRTGWSPTTPQSVRQAHAFNNEVTRQYAAQNARQAVQPEIERMRSTPPDDPQAVRQAFAAKHPDFEQLEPEMDRLILEDGALDIETKQWLADLASQGGAGKQRALEYLYMTAAATRAPVRAKVAKEERQRRKVSADEARLAATVSSAEGSSTRTPLPEAELAVVRRRNAIREKAGMPLLPEE
jgi:hypothetical protein